jgi:hypothetical protein
MNLVFRPTLGRPSPDRDVATPMIFTHVLDRAPFAARSPSTDTPPCHANFALNNARVSAYTAPDIANP